MSQNRNEVHLKYEKEIEELIAKMTVREKIGQCIMIEPNFLLKNLNGANEDEVYSGVLDPDFMDKLLNEYNIGFFFFGGDSRIGDGSPSAWADYILKVKEYVKKTRLKIPMMFGIDAVHGVNFLKGSTIFSHNLGVTATWNPELAKKYTRLVGNELTSIGFNLNFAPAVDVARDQRWGRVYESLGEDPYLASVISKSFVEGFQEKGDLAACAKHFIGYGESNNGMDRTPADLSDRSILEMHVPPFEGAIKSGVLTIMINGGDVNGVPMPVSKKLINGLLRERLQFKGITLSDWQDVDRIRSRHMVSVDKKTAIGRAFNAGLDLNMAVFDIKAVDVMEELVQEGTIKMERLDAAVRNIVGVKYKLGLFEKKPLENKNPAALVGNRESKNTAKQIALESITLLKNEKNLLPLSKKVKSILVTGIAADSKRYLCGGWTSGWAGAKEEDLECQTVLEALREKVPPDTKITYISDGSQLEAEESKGVSKENFDVCISIVSEEPFAEWFGDSMSLKIEEKEEKLLKAAYKTGIPVVMVAIIGRPQNLIWEDTNIPAIIWAYLPGTEGARPIADVLFGDYNPSGRIPISFPKDANQIPVVYNARRYESDLISTRYEPLYPFGYGLSYTEFTYNGLIVPGEVKTGQNVTVSVQVKNSGDVDGYEVVQLYLKDLFASVTRPLKSLGAFKKVFLAAGEEKTVVFDLTPETLSLYDEDLTFVEEKRTIEIHIGDQNKKCTLI